MNDYNVMPIDAIDTNQRGNGVIPSTSNGMLVTFFEGDYYMGKKSKLEGRPIYEKRTYIKFFVDDKSEHIRLVKESDKSRFAPQWAAYTANQDSHGIVGTMLDTYAKASGNLVNAELEHLRTNKIFTVEQLAEVSDAHMQSIGGHIRKQKSDAAIWLEELKAGKGERKMMEELSELRSQLEAMKSGGAATPEQDNKVQEELDNLKAQNLALQEMNKEILEQYKLLSQNHGADEPEKKKRGRPPKKAEA